MISNQFIEKKFNPFFMRTEFSGKIDEDLLLKEAKSVLPPGAKARLTANTKKIL